MRRADAAFYAIPASLMVVAATFAWRAYRADDPGRPELEEPLPKVSICQAARARCARGEILITTGVERPGNAPPCEERSAGRCARACVSEGVALEGVSDSIARTQLCDAPVDVRAWVEGEQTVADLGEDGGACTADGWGPSDDGVIECILRSAKDPDALGLVVHRVRCRTGVVAVVDRTPRMVQRDQAIALWCRRDADALADAGLDLDAAPADATSPDADASRADAGDAETDVRAAD